MLFKLMKVHETQAQPDDVARNTAGAEGRLEVWRLLEGMLKSGLCKSIGVSNFQAHHLDALCAKASVSDCQ